jgi:hypothetical protein
MMMMMMVITWVGEVGLVEDDQAGLVPQHLTVDSHTDPVSRIVTGNPHLEGTTQAAIS